MLKRLILLAGLIIALASPALAETLGPSTNSNVGSDPSTLNTLQPATPNGLQSADSQSGGINQPTSGTSLQPAGSRSDFPANLDISSEADGAPHNPNPAPTHLNQLILGIIGVLMVFCAYFTYRISKLMEAKTAVIEGPDNLIEEPLASTPPESEDTEAPSDTQETADTIEQSENTNIDTTSSVPVSTKAKSRSTKKAAQKPSRKKSKR